MAKPDYTAVEDFRLILDDESQAQATDDSQGTELVKDDEMLEEYLAIGESRVESYLLEYDLSEIRSNAPASIKYAALFIAAYLLMMRSDLTVSQEVSNTYNEFIAWLQEIQSGDAQVPGISAFDSSFVGYADKSAEMVLDHIPHADHIVTL